MKKVLIAMVFVLTAGSLFGVSAGLNVGLSPIWINNNISNKITPTPLITFTGSQNYFNIGGWIDFDYARLTISYQGSIGTVAASGLTNGVSYTNGIVVTNSTSYLNIELLGKLPIKISDGFSIWPAIGLEYSICLFDGMTTTNALTNADNNDRNDLWLKAGIGADINLGGNVYLVPVVMFGVDLTPLAYQTSDKNIDDMTSAWPYGHYSTYSDLVKNLQYDMSFIKLDINIGLGFKF